MRVSLAYRSDALTSKVMYLPAILSLTSGIIHLWIMQVHFAEWWGYGFFFLVIAISEGLYGVVLLNWPRRAFFILGIIAHLAVLALYLVSRTSGIPAIGPHAGLVEKVSVIDIASKSVELALIVTLVVLVFTWHASPSPETNQPAETKSSS